jgi:hypothetical protein
MQPFTDTLAELRGGHCNEEIAEALREVIEAVRRTGRAGTVTLKLEVSLATKGQDDRIMIEDTITAKAPPDDLPATFLFVDERQNLSKQDPQQKLAFRHGIAEPPKPAPLAEAPPAAPLPGG